MPYAVRGDLLDVTPERGGPAEQLSARPPRCCGTPAAASASGPPVALRSGARIYRGVSSINGSSHTWAFSAHHAASARRARESGRQAELLDACDRRTVVVWEEATAVRHRVLMRPSADGRTFSPERILSEAVKASPLGPDVAVTPRGEFIAAWQEQGSSSVKTVVRTLRVATP